VLWSILDATAPTGHGTVGWTPPGDLPRMRAASAADAGIGWGRS
jgi:hypothetical protein